MKKLILLIMTATFMASCGGKKNDEPAPVPNPEAAQLLFPAENELCSQANVVSATQSVVDMQWGKAAAADSYQIYVKNLETGEVISQPATNTSAAVTLTRNMPYSWYVVSKSGATAATAQSKTFKFFNPGPGTQSHPPFPADLLDPAFGQQLPATTTSVNLRWQGGDVDKDLVSYTIYFGTAANPPVFKAGVAADAIFLADVPVTSGTTYYWRVVSTDAKGNTSDSGVTHFKVK